jgi:hypothetical protein
MSKQSEFAALLGLNPLFSGLGADSINKIAALCHTQYLAAGDYSRRATAGTLCSGFDEDRFASRPARPTEGGWR